ncbi:MAG TPA: hypothetical protein VIV65_11675, partial [Gemmatimonadaceae bacterium]
MNAISGRVIAKESGLGIPDLLVVAYDLDPQTRPEETIAAVADQGGAIDADRLFGVVTGKNGEFLVTFEDHEFQIRNPDERRPDLFLQVLAPEEPGRSLDSRLLYASNAIRQNAGRVEQYLIRLPSDLL